jgi:hypothetical protein
VSQPGGEGSELVSGLDRRGGGEKMLESTLVAQVGADPAAPGESGAKSGHDVPSVISSRW